MRCLTCKYDLTHLTEHRCPECGRAFDPNDPYTFDAHDARAIDITFWLKIAWIIAVLGLIGLFWKTMFFPWIGELTF